MTQLEKEIAKAKRYQALFMRHQSNGHSVMASISKKLRDAAMTTARFEKLRTERHAVPYSEVVEALKQADFIIHMMMPGIANTFGVDFKKLNDGTILIADTLRRIKDAGTK